VLSVQAGQPVFSIGAFGGVARLVIDLIRGQDRERSIVEFPKTRTLCAGNAGRFTSSEVSNDGLS